MSLTELKSKYRKVSSIDKVSKGWQEEYDASSKQVICHSMKVILCELSEHNFSDSVCIAHLHTEVSWLESLNVSANRIYVLVLTLAK
jgi:hypothetical protein